MSIQNLTISQKDIHRFCRQYHVRELVLFGSALRDDFDSNSDVDLMVDFEPEAQVGFLTLSRMQRELATIFQRPVDLVSKAGLKPIVRQEVLSNVQVLYASRETVS
ncbi:MAG TPA: nucleotidyltransferase [Candidatus Latescibacteria bacterium]|nr:nucleotidyltransferase [Candidatus Latescibacterota bacterium]